MATLPFGEDTPDVSAITDGANALGLPAFGDLVGALFGQDRFSNLVIQDESDFKQFGTNVPDRRNWSGVKDKSTPEYFFLIRYGGKSVQIPFNVNPQREIITHPHAMTIAYTQGGGKVIQSDGMTSKDITIQGQTGLYPGQGTKVKPTSGVGSGFEQIKFLENLFQRYCFLKRFGDQSKTLQLVYVNRRLQDAWVVEPKTFTREDAIEHNFSFGYTIVLETVYPYDGSDAKSVVENLLSQIPGFSTLDSVIQGIGEAADDLNAVENQITAIASGFVNTVMGELTQLASAYASLVTGLKAFPGTFKKDVVEALNSNLVATANSLEAAGAPASLVGSIIKTEKWVKKSLTQDKLYQPSPKAQSASVTTTQSTQASSFKNSDGSSVSPAEAKAVGAASAKPSASQLVAGINDPSKAQAGSSTLQAIAQSPSQIQAISAKNPTLAAQLNAALQASNKAKSVTSVGSAVAGSSSNLSMSSPTSSGTTTTAPGTKAVALSGPLSPFSIVPPGIDAKQAQAAWQSTIKTDLSAIDPSNADYKTATVNQGDDIQTLALRLIGDPAKWPQLVMLNNLRYPYVADQSYITANSLTNVIPWLGTIVYPAPKSTSIPPTRIFRNETDASLALTPFERAMGNDIFVDPVLCDVVWGANDLTLTYGIDNLKQFIRQRVTLRKGRLRRALNKGFTDFLGQSSAQLEVLRAEARGLFLDDERIASCEAVQIEQSEHLLIIWLRVVVRDLQEPILEKVAIAA